MSAKSTGERQGIIERQDVQRAPGGSKERQDVQMSTKSARKRQVALNSAATSRKKLAFFGPVPGVVVAGSGAPASR